MTGEGEKKLYTLVIAPKNDFLQTSLRPKIIENYPHTHFCDNIYQAAVVIAQFTQKSAIIITRTAALGPAAYELINTNNANIEKVIALTTSAKPDLKNNAFNIAEDINFVITNENEIINHCPDSETKKISPRTSNKSWINQSSLTADEIFALLAADKKE